MGQGHFGGGGRPRNEFTGSTARIRTLQQPENFDESSVWPELRIVRQADIRSDLAPEWHEFLDELGEATYGTGKARTLGSMAVVHVPAKEMGMMLQERYGRRHQTHVTARKRARQIADEFDTFASQEFIGAYDKRSVLDDMRYEGIETMLTGFVMSHELDESTVPIDATVYTRPASGSFADMPVPEPPTFGTLLDQSSAAPYNVAGGGRAADLFGQATLDVSAIKVFGKDGLGLDLSQNELLYEEHSKIVGFLKRQGFNTSRLPANFTPHATIFDSEEHRRGTPIKLPDTTAPSSIDFGRPKAITN